MKISTEVAETIILGCVNSARGQRQPESRIMQSKENFFGVIRRLEYSIHNHELWAGPNLQKGTECDQRPASVHRMTGSPMSTKPSLHAYCTVSPTSSRGSCWADDPRWAV